MTQSLEPTTSLPYYGIYEVVSGNLEVYQLVGGFHQQLKPNERGHWPLTR